MEVNKEVLERLKGTCAIAVERSTARESESTNKLFEKSLSNAKKSVSDIMNRFKLGFNY